jgi:type III secretion protein W
LNRPDSGGAKARNESKIMVDFSIQNQPGVSRNVAEAGGAERFAGAAAGSLAGYQVKAAESPLASLADAAEELTFGVDNTKELALKERKAKEGGNASFLEKVAEYQALMEQARGRDQLELLYAFLKNNRDPQAALSKAKEWAGNDPGLAWAALRQAREALKDEAPAVALEAIDKALEELEAREVPAIRAGIQGTLEGQAHPGLGTPLELGATYRQTVCAFYDNIEDVFAFVLEKYGADQFEAGLDFLFRSLANDLESDQRSHEKAHLEAVGASLGKARIINGAHALVARLLDRWQGVHGVQGEWTPMSFLREVLRLKKNNYLAARDIDALLVRAKAPDIEREVLFLQEFLGTARSFSPLFFEGDEGRMKFIAAAQESLDLAIAREDEALLAQQKE